MLHDKLSASTAKRHGGLGSDSAVQMYLRDDVRQVYWVITCDNCIVFASKRQIDQHNESCIHGGERGNRCFVFFFPWKPQHDMVQGLAPRTDTSKKRPVKHHRL